MGNNGHLNGRVALITGGGGEIGAAIASRFAIEGACVAVVDVSAAKASDVTDRINKAGGRSLGIAGDVSVPERAAEAVARTSEEFGALHILVNVAAADTPNRAVEHLSYEEWSAAMSVNLGAPFLMAKYAIPHLRKAGGGAIVNIASQLGHMGVPGRSAYCSSKAGLIRLTQIVAMECAADNIRVNSISPGAILTDRSSYRYGGKAEAAAVHGPRHLLGRPGTVDEVANAALFLVSEQSSFVTATDLLVDGGYTAFKGTVDKDGKVG